MAIRTKYMCSWCAVAPAHKELTPHTRCRGYDASEDVGCLCAAHGHQGHPDVIAYQMRSNHCNEAAIREYWRRYNLMMGAKVTVPKMAEDAPAFSFLAVNPATGDLHIAKPEDIAAGRTVVAVQALTAGTPVRSENGQVTAVPDETQEEGNGQAGNQEG